MQQLEGVNFKMVSYRYCSVCKQSKPCVSFMHGTVCLECADKLKSNNEIKSHRLIDNKNLFKGIIFQLKRIADNLDILTMDKKHEAKIFRRCSRIIKKKQK
jgi:hypothetical protein